MSLNILLYKEITRPLSSIGKRGLSFVCNVLVLLFFQNEYMKDDFFIKIETWHKPDLGTTDNVSY